MSRVALPPSFLGAPIAHRGYHDRPAGIVENSPRAFAAAVAAGYGIELDVQRSADGQAMVFHDERLERLTAETGLVVDRSAAELGRIPLRFTTDRIPTLREVLTLVGGRVPVLIEIKEALDTMQDTPGLLEAAVARELAAYRGPVAVMSFNPHCVAHMARLAPEVPRGLTTESYDPAGWAPLAASQCDRLRAIPDYDRTGASFISHEAADLARPRVAELKAQGARVLCWTIRSAAAEAEARKIADNVTFEGYAARIGG
jgi:glycerophosphoryl diester phosphodiesterase